MTEIAGAILSCQLQRLDMIHERLDSARRKLLEHLRDLELRLVPDDNRARGLSGIVAVLDTPEGAVAFEAALLAEGVPAARIYGGKTVYEHEQLRVKRTSGGGCPFSCAAYPTAVDYAPGLCPKSEQLVARSVGVPLGPLYTEAHIEGIALAIRKIVNAQVHRR
jgi:8-amino-3,8-dideoxy-alpha-D-manno-octulosonate transaminase